MKCKNTPYIISGMCGSILSLLILISIYCFWSPTHLTAIKIINPEIVKHGLVSSVADISPNHVAAIIDLENKGILLSPDEYTSHISSFYSTLVAVLVGLFVLFSILSYVISNDNSDKKIKEASLEVRNEIRDKVKQSIAELLADSNDFGVRIDAAAAKYVSQNVAKQDDLDELKKSVDGAIKNISDLFCLYRDIDESLNLKEEIS